MIIAEEFLLLVTSEDGKAIIARDRKDITLAGAALAELSLLGRVAVTPKGRLATADPSSTGDPTLDALLAFFAQHEGDQPKKVLAKAGKGLYDDLARRLATAGILREEHSRLLGLVDRTQWPTIDPAPREQIQRDLTAVLLGSEAPDARRAVLLSLLLAADDLASALPDTGLSKRDLKKRAKEVTSGTWATEAVRKAIESANAAITAVVLAGVVAGSSTS